MSQATRVITDMPWTICRPNCQQILYEMVITPS